MTNKEIKVNMFNEAILRSSVAINKGASVEIIDGKVEYRILGHKATGTYKMRSNYKEILCMLQQADIKQIMAI